MRDRRVTSGGRPSDPGPRAFLLSCASLLVAALVCAGPLADGHHRAPAPAQPTERVALTASTQPAGLADTIARIDAMGRSSRAEYGVAVFDRTTGQLTLGEEGAVAFFSASVVKLFTVVDILHRTETGAAKLTPAQHTQIQRALSLSDDKAMDALWHQFGGPRTVSEMITLAGLRDTRPPDRPGEWGETRLSPQDVLAVYQYAMTSLNPQNRDTVLQSLSTAGADGADGFNQSFGLLRNPRLGGVAAKQGWMIDGSHMYLHSTGMVGPNHRYLVAVLSKQPASVGWAAGRQRLDTAIGTLTGSLGLLGAGGIPGSAM
ncbi:MAG: hypothetical protein QOG57_4942 [Pseudonocardiales bacterium]|jgi:hypothetical protein|nr:hypothetical protein [Pseudonocardiales bacterium]